MGTGAGAAAAAATGAAGGACVIMGGGAGVLAAGAVAAAAGLEVGVGTMPLEAFCRALIHRRASETVGALSSIGLPLSRSTGSRRGKNMKKCFTLK